MAPLISYIFNLLYRFKIKCTGIFIHWLNLEELILCLTLYEIQPSNFETYLVTY